MKVTVIGAGNSGLAMAAHLGSEGNAVTLWNRSKATIDKLIHTRTIYCNGIISCSVEIDLVTDDMEQAIEDAELILITTPANSHQELAEKIAKCIRKEAVIILNPGRTLGALEFSHTYDMYQKELAQTIAETQTIIYTCRKIGEDSVYIISLKAGVYLSALEASENEQVIAKLPPCMRPYFIPAKSMIQTSIGNVGMILHCAPLLLNTGWTENSSLSYKYYYEGITPSIGRLIEKIDEERVTVSRRLGYEVEATSAWLKRTYHLQGSNLYECIQNNKAYRTIDAPASLHHRYILEDVTCGLVPMEALGKALGLKMHHTSMIIDLASCLMDIDFRMIGRKPDLYIGASSKEEIIRMFRGRLV